MPELLVVTTAFPFLRHTQGKVLCPDLGAGLCDADRGFLVGLLNFTLRPDEDLIKNAGVITQGYQGHPLWISQCWNPESFTFQSSLSITHRVRGTMDHLRQEEGRLSSLVFNSIRTQMAKVGHL